jgi:hypothetical protein
MPRVPYEYVALEVNRYLIKAVVSKTSESRWYWWDQYLCYLDACGWTDRDFDNETLRRIEIEWERIFKKQLLN